MAGMGGTGACVAPVVPKTAWEEWEGDWDQGRGCANGAAGCGISDGKRETQQRVSTAMGRCQQMR